MAIFELVAVMCIAAPHPQSPRDFDCITATEQMEAERCIAKRDLWNGAQSPFLRAWTLDEPLTIDKAKDVTVLPQPVRCDDTGYRE